MAWSETTQETIERLPSPEGDCIQHLRHTVAAYESCRDREMALIATSGIYPEGVLQQGSTNTGLTWGDLRQILALLDH